MVGGARAATIDVVLDTATQPIDARLLRVQLGLDGRLERPTVLADCVVAAQLCALVLSGHLVSVDGRAVPTVVQSPVPGQVAGLLARIVASPNRPWGSWFSRTRADPLGACKQLVARLEADGVWSPLAAPRWWRHGRSWRYVDCAASDVKADTLALEAAETAGTMSSRDAVTLELLVISRARTWIPLTPPPVADFLAKAHDLDTPRRTSCRDILETLIDVRYTAAQDGGSANPIGNG